VKVVIPPNGTALVTFPGSDLSPVEIGSGSWHWSMPYHDPDVRVRYTVDDVIEEIMSEPTARAVIMEIASRSENADFLSMILQNQSALTLREAIGMLSNPGDLLTQFSKALAKPESE